MLISWCSHNDVLLSVFSVIGVIWNGAIILNWYVCLRVLFRLEIVGSETLPQPTERDDTVAWYPWTINNKYYTADVRLCAVPNTYAMSSEIAQSMQAFIAYFDSKVVCNLRPMYAFKCDVLLFTVMTGVCRKMGWKS